MYFLFLTLLLKKHLKNYHYSKHFIKKMGLMDKIQAKKLHKPLFYLPLQAFEKMNKKSAFTVVVK